MASLVSQLDYEKSKDGVMPFSIIHTYAIKSIEVRLYLKLQNPSFIFDQVFRMLSALVSIQDDFVH